MNYQEYLLTPVWNELKKAALARADYRCQVCNSDNSLNIHHRKYPRVLGKEPVSDLVVLCRNCHELFHSKKRIVQKARIIATGMITPGRSKYHHWIKSTDPAKLRALCNPGMLQPIDQIFPPTDTNIVCKVCLSQVRKERK